MEIKEIQEKVKELVKALDDKFNCKHDNNNAFIHLVEEVGELGSQINNPNIRNKQLDLDNLKEELGDILILVMQLASNNNIDVEDTILNKIKILKERHNLTL